MKDQDQTTKNGDCRDTPIPPPIPPPAPPQSSSRNPSSLLSPWWSAEPLPERPAEQNKKGRRTFINFTRIANAIEYGADGQKTGKSTQLFSERCYLSTRKDLGDQSNDGIPARAPSECRMVCFLRENEQRRKERQEKAKSFWNPFHGLWIVVATTHARCLEHTAEKDITKKSHSDYYTIEFGERFSGSGDDAKRVVTKTFAPLQELTRRYVQSWQDGTQALFFQRFWESTKRGDAFHLVRDNTKKLLQSVTGADKKGQDDDSKKGSNQ
ncbi:hypothetical protein BDB00DRAFT_790968 [Zychaea mexicana]|uniref:uncharacterized protein n=1 Tax=Zychaea mexicana TaxID=64656 RepID=UPI0022FEEE82|nr:uncharacterized protein BDB00DRAFT_790968 [Zychaea mexicana]KAI9489544.1 hypothetical protein BDB00DRAFT_790968 [Zychaea mexicana]